MSPGNGEEMWQLPEKENEEQNPAKCTDPSFGRRPADEGWQCPWNSSDNRIPGR